MGQTITLLMRNAILILVLGLASVACGGEQAPAAETAGSELSAVASPARKSDRGHGRTEIKTACHTLTLLSIECDEPESVESCGARFAAFEAECFAAADAAYTLPTLGPIAGMTEEQAFNRAVESCRGEALWIEQVAPGSWVGVCGDENGTIYYAITK